MEANAIYPNPLADEDGHASLASPNLPGSLHETEEIVEPVHSSFKDNEQIMDLVETLECPLCFNICSKEPIYQCPEGHLLCSDCNMRLLNCPSCDHTLVNARNRTAESLASKLRTLVGERELESSGGEIRDGLIISVVEPLKIGKGLTAKIVFKIDSRTLDGKNRYSVSRKFGDILRLHYKLYEEYFKSGVIIPPPPRNKIYDPNGFFIKFSSMEEIKSKKLGSITKRTSALDRYMKRLAKHTVIRKDPHFRAFIQENEVPLEISSVKKPGYFKRNPKILEWFSFDEKDPWFQTRMNRLEELSNRLNSFQNHLKAISRMKEELVQRDMELQRNMVQLNLVDTQRFNASMEKAASSHRQSCAIYWNQCIADAAIVDLVEDYHSMINSALSIIAYRRKKEGESKKLKKKMLDESAVVDSEEALKSLNQMVQRELEHFEVIMSQEFEEQFVAYNRTYYETLHSNETLHMGTNHI